MKLPGACPVEPRSAAKFAGARIIVHLLIRTPIRESISSPINFRIELRLSSE
jgi:hypothetical protein